MEGGLQPQGEKSKCFRIDHMLGHLVAALRWPNPTELGLEVDPEFFLSNSLEEILSKRLSTEFLSITLYHVLIKQVKKVLINLRKEFYL